MMKNTHTYQRDGLQAKSWFFQLGIAIASLGSLAVSANADTVLDFTDGVTNGQRTIEEDGFRLTSSGWYNNAALFAWPGVPNDSITLEKITGEPFSLHSMDLKEVTLNSPQTITFNGYLAGGGNVYASIRLDGDGNRSPQAYSFPSSFVNLTHVTWRQTSGYHLFDNVVLDAVSDSDGDLVNDDIDNCPDVANAEQADADGDGVGDACDVCFGLSNTDNDHDGICDDADNCPDDANADQADADEDLIGDVCETDSDGDSVIDDDDNCPDVANSDQADSDGDGEGDVCDTDDDNDGVDDVDDNCHFTSNADQADFDSDGQGDVCDGDDDADGVDDGLDFCPATPLDVSIIDANGCSGQQYVDLVCGEPCDHANHGQYVKCVVHAANDAFDLGLLTNKQRAAIVRAAAKNKCTN